MHTVSDLDLPQVKSISQVSWQKSCKARKVSMLGQRANLFLCVCSWGTMVNSAIQRELVGSAFATNE